MAKISSKELTYLREKLVETFETPNRPKLDIINDAGSYSGYASKYEPLWDEIKKSVDTIKGHPKELSRYSAGSPQSLMNLFSKKKEGEGMHDTIINAYYYYLSGKTRADFLAENPLLHKEWEQSESDNPQEAQEFLLDNVQTESKNTPSISVLDKPLEEIKPSEGDALTSNLPLPEPTSLKSNMSRIWVASTFIFAALFVFTLLYFLNISFPKQTQKIRASQKVLYMTTSWTINSNMAKKAREFARDMESKSNNELKIIVFYNFQLPTNKCDTCNNFSNAYKALKAGEIDMLYTSAYYDNERKESIFYSAIPGGMGHEAMNEWLGDNFEESDSAQWADGYRLWRKLHGQDLLVYPAGNTGNQWGGFFKTPIQSIEDFAGKKGRVGGGFTGLLVKSLGAKIYPAYEKDIFKLMATQDTLDWIEFMNPSEDYKIGMHLFSKTYHYIEEEGWHEPNSVLELLVNKNSLVQLSASQQQSFYKKLAVFNGLTGLMREREEEYKNEMRKEHTFFTIPKEVKNVLYTKMGEEMYRYIKQRDAKSPLMDSVYESYKKHCKDCKIVFK